MMWPVNCCHSLHLLSVSVIFLFYDILFVTPDLVLLLFHSYVSAFISPFESHTDVPSLITLVNTQNVSVTKIVDSSSIQRAETKYGLRIQFLALVVMIHEVWLNA